MSSARSAHVHGHEGVGDGGAAEGVSVITATIGRMDGLRAKAEALARQTLPRERWEWIVAFDGTPPAVERELRAVVPQDVRLTTVTTGGTGAGPARDAAADTARFPVLYLSDDDCVPAADALERHVIAQREPGIYVGSLSFIDDNGIVEPAPPAPRPGWWNVNGANTSVPTRDFRSVGGFGDTAEGYGGEDVWLGWRLVRRGLPVRALPAAQVDHLGPNPMRAAPVERAASAGANAVRLGRIEPRVRWRLGVHPLLLVLKLGGLALVPAFLNERVRGERAYTRAAWAELTTGRRLER